jgi:hypothetical protein
MFLGEYHVLTENSCFLSLNQTSDAQQPAVITIETIKIQLQAYVPLCERTRQSEAKASPIIDIDSWRSGWSGSGFALFTLDVLLIYNNLFSYEVTDSHWSLS